MTSEQAVELFRRHLERSQAISSEGRAAVKELGEQNSSMILRNSSFQAQAKSKKAAMFRAVSEVIADVRARANRADASDEGAGGH